MSPQKPIRAHPCRVAGCDRDAEFYAKDNHAKHGHVCRDHWRGMSRVERDRYVERRVRMMP